jgi:SAM-dependent methyltransferase
VVAERCQTAGLSNVSFRAMAAEALDLPDASFDIVLCSLGLMYVADPVRALLEMRRVLRTEGRLGLMVWSTGDKVTHHGIVRRAMARYTAPVSPERRLPGPLDLGEPGLIERYVAAAGFPRVVVERRTLDCVYRDAEQFWVQHFASVLSDVYAALESLAADQRDQLHRDIHAEVERYRRGDRIHMPSEAIYVTARR